MQIKYYGNIAMHPTTHLSITSVLNDYERKKICRQYEAKLTKIKKQIISITNNAPFTCKDREDPVIDILNGYGLQSAFESYNEKSLNIEPYEEIDLSSLNILDIIEGYYDIESIKRELKQIKMASKVTPVEIEFTYTLPKWYKPMFQLIFPHLRFDISFFVTLTAIRNKINRVMKSYGFELPTMEELKNDLTEYYLVTRGEKRKYLPTLEELKHFEINDTLYIINYVHGAINDEETIDIPENMDLYRILASDFGSLACTRGDELQNYISKINNFLNIPRKNTHRNNIKNIKRIITTLLKKTRDFMRGKRESLFMGTERDRLRYIGSQAHVHHFKGSPMMLKTQGVYLNKVDPYYGILLVHPRWSLNLLDYIDVELRNGFMRFNTRQIMDLIKSKYVLFIDLSCSSSDKANATNENLNRMKSRAKEIEGKSITKEIEQYLDLSPYNESVIAESRVPKSKTHTNHLSLTKLKSKKSKKYRSLNNKSRSRRYKSLTKPKLTLRRVMNL
jgi:hypothetical protein